jgi:hypothetical protein
MKRLSECAYGAESFRFVKDLRAAMRGDEENWNLRLKIAQICDDLKTGDVRQIEIDDAEAEWFCACLINALEAFSNKHDFIAARFEYQSERVTYRGFVVYDEDSGLFHCEPRSNFSRKGAKSLGFRGDR